MQVQVKVSPRIIIIAEGPKETEVFEQLAQMQEVFGQQKCGKCNCEDLRFVVREIDDNKFYELRCTNIKCRAVLSFGCNKKGFTLFPKRKGEPTAEGKTTYLPANGWQIYNPETKMKE